MPSASDLAAFFSRGGRAVRNTFDLRDAFAFGGLALVAIGLWQIYPAAAFIVSGAALFWLGVRK